MWEFMCQGKLYSCSEGTLSLLISMYNWKWFIMFIWRSFYIRYRLGKCYFYVSIVSHSPAMAGQCVSPYFPFIFVYRGEDDVFHFHFFPPIHPLAPDHPIWVPLETQSSDSSLSRPYINWKMGKKAIWKNNFWSTRMKIKESIYGNHFRFKYINPYEMKNQIKQLKRLKVNKQNFLNVG